MERNHGRQEVKTIEDAKRIVTERGLTHIKVGLFDNDGIMRGKYMSKDKFLSSLDSGFAFCDVVLGWDSKDQLYDNAEFTGWHTGYPDAPCRILPETCRDVLEEEGMLLFIAEFTGEAETVCPGAHSVAYSKSLTSLALMPSQPLNTNFLSLMKHPKVSVRKASVTLTQSHRTGSGIQ